MRSSTNLTSLLSATFLIASALASPAAAQSTSEPRFEVRPLVGAYIPTGDHRDLLDDAVTLGAQGAIALTNHFSLVGTLAWSPSSDKRLALADEVDVFQYDIGAEYRQPFVVGTSITLSPFIGLGVGGRTYDYGERDRDAEADFAGYGALGAQLRVGTLGFRLEARDYISQFEGLSGEMERTTRNDVMILSALTLFF